MERDALMTKIKFNCIDGRQIIGREDKPKNELKKAFMEKINRGAEWMFIQDKAINLNNVLYIEFIKDDK